MPEQDSILNLPDFHIVGAISSNPCQIRVRYAGKVVCPHCESTCLRKKDRYVRRVRHESIGTRMVWLLIEACKWLCTKCKRYFNQRFPGIRQYFRSTEAFRREIFEQHFHGITQRQLSRSYRIGHATVERWYQDLVGLQLQEYRSRPCPRVLGIDEHFFTRKKGYATTFADLEHRRVFDVTLGRSETALKPYLNALLGKNRTQVVVMDLSETYRSIAKKHFPNAKIVADRFHVIRLVSHAYLETWKHIDPVGRRNRGLLSLMRRHRWNLSAKNWARLQSYLEHNPVIQPIYEFKQRLNQLLLRKHQTAKQCRRLIPELLDIIEQLRHSLIRPLTTLGKTLYSWREEIARMWRFTKSNSITEGLHNKMEMLSRRAFGFRNFQNYRLRVRVMCG